MSDRKRVLITGAAGRIGTMVRQALAYTYDLKGIDIRPIEGFDSFVANMTDYASIRPAFEGMDVVIDLANNPSGGLSWEEAYANNIPSSYNCLRAAQEAGVKRYILTSSNRATEGYERDEPYASICRGEYAGLQPGSFPLITPAMPVRPNGPYGIGKCLAEAAARYFSDYHGMSCICLRLGTVHGGEEPRAIRQFATLLTPRDLQQLYRCAVEAPDDLRFATFYGVSNNRWRFWEISDAERLIGFRPHDDAEAWRGKVDL
ncbi:MAG TPA: NAD(P)-dependent oxidoreductase [Dehalococcoidia bacterium]|nr:NAD(P)-dependent oxidoreductase [Dehalococcoidia bacterium]